MTTALCSNQVFFLGLAVVRLLVSLHVIRDAGDGLPMSLSKTTWVRVGKCLACGTVPKFARNDESPALSFRVASGLQPPGTFLYHV